MYGGSTAGVSLCVFIVYTDEKDVWIFAFHWRFCGRSGRICTSSLGDVNLLKLPDDVPDEKGLYLSDVIATSWNCVVDTGVKEGDVVAIWGAGPIGQMCVDFAFMNGASRVILIDCNWRLDYVKQKNPKVETLNFSELPKGSSVTSKLKEMVHEGPDVALECVAGEYPKAGLTISSCW